MFANPGDVAQADQAAAALLGVTVRLRGTVPLGRMYVVSAERVAQIRHGFELEQFAEEVIDVEPARPVDEEPPP